MLRTFLICSTAVRGKIVIKIYHHSLVRAFQNSADKPAPFLLFSPILNTADSLFAKSASPAVPEKAASGPETVKYEIRRMK
jgi:hypothetical protein